MLLCLVLTGCAGGSGNGLFAAFSAHDDDARDVEVSEAQACAIGYDLARAIHERVSLRRVVIVAPGQATPCERHALDYLRRGGFRIDETGQNHGKGGGVSLDIELSRPDGDAIFAIATLGGDLRIARGYLPVRTGVIAAGPVSVQHLNADTYAPREGAPRGGAPRPDTYGGAS